MKTNLLFILIMILSSCSIINVSSLDKKVFQYENLDTREVLLEIEKRGDTLYYYHPAYSYSVYTPIGDSLLADTSSIIKLDNSFYVEEIDYIERGLHLCVYWHVNRTSKTISYKNKNFIDLHRSMLVSDSENDEFDVLQCKKNVAFNPTDFPLDRLNLRSIVSPYNEAGIQKSCSYLGIRKINRQKVHCFQYTNKWKYEEQEQWNYLLYLDKKTLIPYAFYIEHFEVAHKEGQIILQPRVNYIIQR